MTAKTRRVSGCVNFKQFVRVCVYAVDKEEPLTILVRDVWNEEIGKHIHKDFYNTGDASSLSQLSFVFIDVANQIVSDIMAQAMENPRVLAAAVQYDKPARNVRRHVKASLSKSCGHCFVMIAVDFV